MMNNHLLVVVVAVIAAAASTITVVQASETTAALASEVELRLYVDLHHNEECAKYEAIASNNNDGTTAQQSIPESGMAEAVFDDGWDYFLGLSEAVSDIGVEGTARNRKLRGGGGQEEEDGEGRQLLVCRACRDASNWRRCVKNRCSGRRRRLSSSRAVEGITVDMLGMIADKIRDDKGMRRLAEGTAAEFKSEHDRALVQDTINTALYWKEKMYPCPLSFDLLLPKLEGVQEAAESTSTGECTKAKFQDECDTTGQCKNKYSGAYDCKNSEGGVCYCGANEVCGCIEEPTSGGGGGGETATCNLDQFLNECKTTGFCQSKYPDAYDCKNSEGGICYCGNNEVCGCPKTPPSTEGGQGDPGTCTKDDYKDECNVTGDCREKYKNISVGNYDCRGSSGDYCECDNKVCGCMVFNTPPATEEEKPDTTTTCTKDDQKGECGSTDFCREKYKNLSVGDYDCNNGGGGYCECDNKVCACLSN